MIALTLYAIGAAVAWVIIRGICTDDLELKPPCKRIAWLSVLWLPALVYLLVKSFKAWRGQRWVR